MVRLPRIQKYKDALAEKCLEAQSGRNGSHWLAKQRKNSNKDQRLHDELNYVDIEPLVSTLVQMKTQLRELELPRPSMDNLPKNTKFL